MFFPLKKTSPASGVINPAMVRRAVVLPQPEGPSRVTNSPSRMSRSKPLSTCSPSKETAMSFREMMVFSKVDASPLRRRGNAPKLVACLLLFTHNPALLCPPAFRKGMCRMGVSGWAGSATVGDQDRFYGPARLLSAGRFSDANAMRQLYGIWGRLSIDFPKFLRKNEQIAAREIICVHGAEKRAKTRPAKDGRPGSR